MFQRFGIALSVQCFLCVAGVESMDHLLVSCPYYAHILGQILFLFDDDVIREFTTWRELLTFALQVYKYQIRRQMNERLHDRGVASPQAMLENSKTSPAELPSRLGS